MFRGLLLLLVLLSPLPAMAQSLEGDWNGTLNIPQGKLRLLFQFYSSNGQIAAYLTSLDQSVMTLHAERTTLTDQQLSISFPTLHGSYQGTWDDRGKTIVGSWIQNGYVLPLTLKPGGIALDLRTPETGDVALKTEGGVLGGTFRRAGAGKIGAVIINGSGPADRNGESVLSKAPGTYRLLAENLAEHGISTLRFDKRGVGESSAAAGPESSLRVQMYAADARLWSAELKRQLGVRCVWFIGHSEGALLAEMATRDNPDICGLVLLAGPGRKLGEIMREQLQSYLPEKLKPRGFAVLTSLEDGRTVADPPLELMDLFRPSVQPYLISEFALDPAALLKELKVPVLILQGDADRNVSIADAKALAAARPDATLKIMAGVNHSQRLEGAPGPAPLAPGVVDTIADFVHQHSQ